MLNISHDVVDVFVSPSGGGNPAGVVLCDKEFYSEATMLAKAKELGFSETVFMLKKSDISSLQGERASDSLNENSWHFRYFTPVEEVPLCGHATIAAIHWLGDNSLINCGSKFQIRTGAGHLSVELSKKGLVWMEMAAPKLLASIAPGETKSLYAPFPGSLPDSLNLQQSKQILEPEIISTGLADIILPISSREILNSLEPDVGLISQISKEYNVCGYHLFALAKEDDEITAYTRNFAPLLGIPEEAATGTASGALAYFLYRQGLAQPGQELCFLQGESMGLPSLIYSKLENNENSEDNIQIYVGGRARTR